MADSVGTPKKKRASSSKVGRHFGAALRRMREAQGKMLADLADYLEVSVPYLSDVERGRREPLSNKRIVLAAEYLDGDPLQLIEEAIRDRGFITLDVDEDDDLRIKAAMMLVVSFTNASDEVVNKLVNVLKRAS